MKLEDFTERIKDIRIQLVESKVTKESLQLQLIDKIDACHKVEEEIVNLIIEIEKLSTQVEGSYKFYKSSK